MSVIVEVDIPVAEFERVAKAESDRVRRANRATAEDLGKQALRLFRGTTRTWREQPEFTVETEASGDEITVLAGTDNPIYGYLDRGTSVRYALMSPDWRSKTTPGSLQAGSGAGRVIVINRNRPRPGIKARRFSDKIRETLDREAEPTFNRNYKQAR